MLTFSAAKVIFFFRFSQRPNIILMPQRMTMGVLDERRIVKNSGDPALVIIMKSDFWFKKLYLQWPYTFWGYCTAFCKVINKFVEKPDVLNPDQEFIDVRSLCTWFNLLKLKLRLNHFLNDQSQFLETFTDFLKFEVVKMAHEAAPPENVGWISVKLWRSFWMECTRGL